jgi:hypothetical protein
MTIQEEVLAILEPALAKTSFQTPLNTIREEVLEALDVELEQRLQASYGRQKMIVDAWKGKTLTNRVKMIFQKNASLADLAASDEEYKDIYDNFRVLKGLTQEVLLEMFDREKRRSVKGV